MDRSHVTNRLLNALPAGDRASILAMCEAVELVNGETLIRAGSPIEHVHFVERGFLSVVTRDGERDQVEIALIGREGMAGVCVALGCSEGPFRIFVQSPGAAWRMPRRAFEEACGHHPALHRTVLKYAQVFTTQVAETGRANARHTVESRLARWLLMAHDRLEQDELSITHERLSLMLGVRRPGVTVSLHILEGEHMIRAKRGTIRILDRAKLGAAAKGSYGLPEAEYQRILANPVPAARSALAA